MSEKMYVNVIIQSMAENFRTVVTKCGKHGRVLGYGPECEYILANLVGLQICRIESPDENEFFLQYRERTGDWLVRSMV